MKSWLLDMTWYCIHDLTAAVAICPRLSPSALHLSCLEEGSEGTPPPEELEAVMAPGYEVSFLLGGATDNLPLLKAQVNKPLSTVNSN